MKKSKRKRDKAERRRASAVDRAERQKTGVKPYLDLPSGAKMFSFDKEGTKKIDIIEYETGKGNPNAKKGELYFERTFWTHRNIGPDGDSVICPAKTLKKPCPVCEYRAKLARRPDADDEELNALKPSERQVFRIVDPKRRKEGIKILDISNFFFGKELDAALRKLKRAGKKKKADKFASPTDGMTCKVEIEEGSYKKGKTFSAKIVQLVPREEQYDEDLVDEGPNLDEILKVLSYDKLKELFDQSVDDDDDDDEDDTDLEDEDDDDEDEDDDDEDDSDDEDEESDDEDEDDSDDDGEDEEDEDSDDDDDDDDDEEEDDDDDDDDDDNPEVKKGDAVKFKYKGKKLTGVVKRIKNGLAHVKSDKRSDPYAVDPDDCVVIDDEDDDDDGISFNDDDDDEEKPRKKKRRK